MLKCLVEAEISLYKIEPRILEVEIKLERVTLKVNSGMHDADPTVGGTAK